MMNRITVNGENVLLEVYNPNVDTMFSPVSNGMGTLIDRVDSYQINYLGVSTVDLPKTCTVLVKY